MKIMKIQSDGMLAITAYQASTSLNISAKFWIRNMYTKPKIQDVKGMTILMLLEIGYLDMFIGSKSYLLQLVRIRDPAPL